MYLIGAALNVSSVISSPTTGITSSFVRGPSFHTTALTASSPRYEMIGRRAESGSDCSSERDLAASLRFE